MLRGTLLYKKPDPIPVTLEATLVRKLADRFVAMDTRGFLYTWFTKPSKQLGFTVEEGCIVYVHADEVTRDVYSMSPKNDQPPVSTAL